MPNFLLLGANIIRVEAITAIRPLDPEGQYKARIAVDLNSSSDNPPCIVVDYESVEQRDLIMGMISRVLLG